MVALKADSIRNRVLIIDDDRMVLESLNMLFAHYGWEVVAVSSCEEALERLDETDYRLAVVDHLMEGKNGLELIRDLKSNSSAQVFMLTGCVEPNLRAAAEKAGVDRFFFKPVQAATMIKALDEF
ncbi:hypothetical protein VDG1235_3692 [Verrucomicrobiia bacterium DG1235]|nr:hypothetical protein VDG1235_3692 [Verrucomicrobiae bacterium DG1235]